MKCGTMWSHIILVSLALWQIGSSISTDNCPDNLEQNKYLQAFGDKCYFFYLYMDREYNAAQSVCREKGGNLVSIKSSGMNSYLRNQLTNYYGYSGTIWIGLSDQADEKDYVWRDGSAMGYSNFESNTGPDTPWWDFSDKIQDCVGMYSWSGQWEDLDCGDNILNGHHHSFICEYNPKPKPPPATTTTSTTTLPATIVSTTTTTTPPATTSTPDPPTTTIASTAAPKTTEPILPNEDFRTTTTPTTTKPTTTFIVPTSEAPSSTPPTPPRSCISIDNCPDNLEQNKYLKAFGDKCYFFYLYMDREYNAAQSICREKGGNLVSIKSSGMNSYLHNQLINYYGYGGKIWIGLSDQTLESHYVWRDGSAMGYSNFKSNTGPDTPLWNFSDKIQDCVAMSPSSGQWEDLDCGDSIINDHHHAFICEYNPKPKPPPATTTTSTTTLPPTIVSTTSTTTPPATTTTPAPPETSTAAVTCPPIRCNLNCGMSGFGTDEKTGCMICKCQEE